MARRLPSVWLAAVRISVDCGLKRGGRSSQTPIRQISRVTAPMARTTLLAATAGGVAKRTRCARAGLRRGVRTRIAEGQGAGFHARGYAIGRCEDMSEIAVEIWSILAGLLLVGYAVWRLLVLRQIRQRLPALLAGGAQVIDVRSPAEFAAGHAAGSQNIPLFEIATKAKHLDRARRVVVCCASGARSARARHWLLSHGFRDVFNAGSWRNLP